MAVLNQSDNSGTDSGFTPQDTQNGSPGSEGSSSQGQMDKFNELLTNVNKLLENDLVQKRIASKTENQGRPVMGNGGQPQPQPQQPQPQPVQSQPQPQSNPQPNTQDVGENNGGSDRDLDLKDYFADKIKTEDGREELKQQIGELTEYLDPDATLEQIQEEVVSEEFVGQVEQLKEMGAI